MSCVLKTSIGLGEGFFCGRVFFRKVHAVEILEILENSRESPPECGQSKETPTIF